MSASMIASFVTFVITGIYTLWFSPAKLDIDITERAIIGSAIFINACYFFYFEAYIEVEKSIKEKLKTVSNWEWVIRTINQTLLFSFWFLLQFQNPTYFIIAMFLLYVLYIRWDSLTKHCFEKRTLFYLDVFGLVLTIFFAILIYLINKNHLENIKPANKTQVQAYQQATPSMLIFLLGGVAFLYLFPPVLGILTVKFNPFKKEYWTAGNRQ